MSEENVKNIIGKKFTGDEKDFYLRVFEAIKSNEVSEKSTLQYELELCKSGKSGFAIGWVQWDYYWENDCGGWYKGGAKDIILKMFEKAKYGKEKVEEALDFLRKINYKNKDDKTNVENYKKLCTYATEMTNAVDDEVKDMIDKYTVDYLVYKDENLGVRLLHPGGVTKEIVEAAKKNRSLWLYMIDYWNNIGNLVEPAEYMREKKKYDIFGLMRHSIKSNGNKQDLIRKSSNCILSMKDEDIIFTAEDKECFKDICYDISGWHYVYFLANLEEGGRFAKSPFLKDDKIKKVIKKYVETFTYGIRKDSSLDKFLVSEPRDLDAFKYFILFPLKHTTKGSQAYKDFVIYAKQELGELEKGALKHILKDLKNKSDVPSYNFFEKYSEKYNLDETIPPYYYAKLLLTTENKRKNAKLYLDELVYELCPN